MYGSGIKTGFKKLGSQIKSAGKSFGRKTKRVSAGIVSAPALAVKGVIDAGTVGLRAISQTPGAIVESIKARRNSAKASKRLKEQLGTNVIKGQEWLRKANTETSKLKSTIINIKYN